MKREEVDEPVEIVPFDPGWPEAFEQEATRLRGALTSEAVTIEHIGSTAVPGLAAKPIVDLMLGVDSLPDSKTIIDELVAAGYEDCGGVPGRRYLRRRAAGAFNVQVVERHGVLWAANLRLRDFLRTSPAAARRYEAAKLAALSDAPLLLAYSEAKRPVVEALLEEACNDDARAG